MEAELRAKAPPRPPGIRRAPAAPRAAPARRSTPRAGGVVTRRIARAEDDGYRNPLVPGLRATADAERLAAALALAAERLEPPGPYDAVATEPDREQATWLAFLLALAGPAAPERQDARRGAAPRFGTASCPSRSPATPARSPPIASGRSAPARRSPASPASRTGRRSGASRACSSGSRCPASAARRASSCS